MTRCANLALHHIQITADVYRFSNGTVLALLEGVASTSSDLLAQGASLLLSTGALIDPRDPNLDLLPEEAVFDRCSPLPFLAVLFYCSFVVLVWMMLLQLVIAIILENIQSTTFQEELAVGQSHIRR